MFFIHTVSGHHVITSQAILRLRIKNLRIHFAHG